METNILGSINFDYRYEGINYALNQMDQPKYQPNRPWVNFISPNEIAIERSTYTVTNILPGIDAGFIPEMTLGKKLLDLREKAIAEGMKLLDEDEIIEEVRRRRGEEEYADIY